MARRTNAHRKEDFLDIGVAIVTESLNASQGNDGLALAHVKITEVAERAGVTKGAIYHIWKSQELYWQELLQYLLERSQLLGADLFDKIAVQLLEELQAPITLGAYANAIFDSVSQDPSFFARVSLKSYLQDPEVRQALATEYHETVLRSEPVLSLALASMQRKLRDDSSLTDLTVAISALLEGICLQYKADPASTPDVAVQENIRLSLFAASAEALFLAFSEPIDAASNPPGLEHAVGDTGPIKIDLSAATARARRNTAGNRSA